MKRDFSSLLATYLSEKTTLRGFFGCNELSILNLMIAIGFDFPEWLRGIPHELNLPRRQSNIQHIRVSINDVLFNIKSADIVYWIIERTNGFWDIGNISDQAVYFENASDAILFKLTYQQ